MAQAEAAMKKPLAVILFAVLAAAVCFILLIFVVDRFILMPVK